RRHTRFDCDWSSDVCSSDLHRCVVVQEQWKPFGAAAEIAANITENVFDELDAPIERVTGEDVPMPYARTLELLATPHEQHVADRSEERRVGKEWRARWAAYQ